jgi:hypothetical protein
MQYFPGPATLPLRISHETRSNAYPGQWQFALWSVVMGDRAASCTVRGKGQYEQPSVYTWAEPHCLRLLINNQSLPVMYPWARRWRKTLCSTPHTPCSSRERKAGESAPMKTRSTQGNNSEGCIRSPATMPEPVLVMLWRDKRDIDLIV